MRRRQGPVVTVKCPGPEKGCLESGAERQRSAPFFRAGSNKCKSLFPLEDSWSILMRSNVSAERTKMKVESENSLTFGNQIACQPATRKVGPTGLLRELATMLSILGCLAALRAWSDSPIIGHEWTNSLGLEFVWIPPGEFTMGSPSNELYRFQQEGPQTEVALSQGL